MRAQSNLVRKQYLVTKDNIKKIEELASSRGTSAADIVRQAIDAYDPQGPVDMDAPELTKLVHEKLKQAITTTRKASKKMESIIHQLEETNA